MRFGGESLGAGETKTRCREDERRPMGFSLAGFQDASSGGCDHARLARHARKPKTDQTEGKGICRGVRLHSGDDG